MDEDNKFKASFKFYKKRKPPPDLSRVIDFEIEAKQVHRLRLTRPRLETIAGLLPVEQWAAFSIPSLPGFYFIQNPFVAGYQEYWVKRCLHDYPCKDNITNLDSHMTLSETDNIWDISHSVGAGRRSLIDRLRWTTLGYHHNWDTKHYSMDQHTPFPSDLGYFSRYIVEALGFSSPYRAEAAIINYYHLNSTLAGHTDHSEFDMEAPLVSVSFGQTAVFLLGGLTRAEEPLAMFVRSGDVMVMSGPCRHAYHAVPKILPPIGGALPPCFTRAASNMEQTSAVSDSEAQNCVTTLKHVDYKPEAECEGISADGTLTNRNRDSSRFSDNGEIFRVSNEGTEQAGCSHACNEPCLLYKSCAVKTCDNCRQLSYPAANHTQTSPSDPTTPDRQLSYPASDHMKTSLCPSDSSTPTDTAHSDACSIGLKHNSSQDSTDCDSSQYNANDINTNIRQCLETLEFALYAEYLRAARVNMNVRQVFKPGQSACDVQADELGTEEVSEKKLKVEIL